MVKRVATKAAYGALALAAIVGIAAASTTPAAARVIIGFGIAPFGYYPGPWNYPYYPYPYYAPVYPAPYYAPAYDASSAATAPAPVQQASWYYCDNPRGYYPYVQHCSVSWRQVPAQPQP